ncbi:ABC transporter substrate-binding protein [Nocardia sp. NPDC047648]|uniref:ABC transporter substrate-binding protein n=1 Tax=Nocardia sp. NPDC047648 TaxID=3155625 RepID=UPI0033C22F30
MPTRTRIAAILAALILTGTFVVGCAGGGPTVTNCSGQTVKIGQSTASNLQYAAHYIATDKGYFDEQGLTIETLELGGGSEAIQALAGGSVDAVSTTFAAILTAAERGAPLVAFAATANRNTADIGIRNRYAPPAGVDLDTAVRALRGLKVAVTSPGSGTDQTLHYLLRHAGMNPDTDVRIVSAGGAAETVAAFANGSVDAYIIGPPSSLVAAERGDGRIMLRLASGIAPDLDNLLYGVAVTSTNTMNHKEAVIRCLALAMNKAVAFIHNQPDQAAALLRPRFREMTDAQFAQSWEPIMKATPPTAAINPSEAAKAAEFVSTVLNKSSVDATKAYDNRFSEDLK